MQAEWFGLVDDATTDNTAAIEKACDSLPSTGGVLQFGGTAYGYRIANLSLNPLITIRGIGGGTARTTSVLIASGYVPQLTTFVVKSGDEGWIIAPSKGFNRLENFRVTGESDAEIGIDIKAADVHTSDISIYGFLNGIGIKMAYNIRSQHDRLNIQGCGLGLFLAGVNHDSIFNNLTIEGSTVGIYGEAPEKAITFNSTTIEGIGNGKLSTSFPGAALLTVSAEILADIGGIAQADFEGGIFLIVTTAIFNGLYMENISTAMFHAAYGSVIQINGSYFNDVNPPPANAPDHIIAAGRAKAFTLLNSEVSTYNARGNPLFDINTSYTNIFLGNRFYHSDGTPYAGAVFENSVGGTVNFVYRSLLQYGTREIRGIKTFNSALVSQDVTSSANAITIDPLLGSIVYVDTLTENTTITSTNERDGQYIEIHVFQDGVGGRTVGWNAEFGQSWSDTGNAPDKKSCIAFRYRGSDSKWYQIGEQAPYHD